MHSSILDLKNRFTKEDDAVMTLMDEIERLSETERASRVEQLPENDLLPPSKKGKFSAVFGTSSSSSSRANTCDVSIADRVKNEVDTYVLTVSEP